MTSVKGGGSFDFFDIAPRVTFCLRPASVLLAQFSLVLMASMALAGPETGLPPLQVFDDDDYGAARQNWALAEDDRGMVHVGNVDGVVLSFDGVRWRSTRVGTETIRSLAADADGRIYVGTVGDFGYLEPDEQGRRHFVSLRDQLPEENREFADVWAIFPTYDAVYFSTFAGLYRISDDGVQVWEPETRFHLAFEVAERIFVREVDRGLFELIDDELQPVPDGDHFADKRVYVMLPWGEREGYPEGSILIGTREVGWYVHDGDGLEQWETGIDEFLPDDLLYHAVRLDNGDLAVATLRGGLSLLDENGRLLRRMTREDGLPDSAVFRLHADRQGGLWMALNNGIAWLKPGSPISHFDRSLGLAGEVLAVDRYQGTIFVATTDGLHRMAVGADGAARFEPVEAIRGQTWGLLPTDDGLLVSAMEGVFRWREGEARMIRPSAQTSYAMLRSRSNPDRIWIGKHTGLAAIRSDGAGGWVDEGRSPEVNDEVRTFHETEDGVLWAGTQYRGVLKIAQDTDPEPGQNVWQQMSSPQRLGIVEAEEYGLIQVGEIDGALRFGSRRGILRYDAERGGLVGDQRFANLFPEGPRRMFPFTQDRQGRVWMYTVEPEQEIQQTAVASPTADGEYQLEHELAAPVFGMTVQAIEADDEGVVWLGADNALYRLDADRRVEPPSFPTLVRGVYERETGQVLYGGYGSLPSLQLAYADNTLRFEYAAPSYERFDATEYRVKLEGLDRDWSAWSSETFRDYTHIREGRYRFRVQSRNVYGVPGEEAAMEFRILPPWYRSLWAYLAYVIAAALLVAGVFQWRSTVLRRRNRILRQLVNERTRKLSEANRALAEQSLTDPLTGLRNRRFVSEQIPTDIAMVDRHYRNQRPDNADLLFMMMDIDHFKEVNDQHGHAAGDRVLQQMAQVLGQQVRDADTIVRWGGEEFLVVGRFADAGFAQSMAERLRQAIAAHPFDIGGGQSLRLTISLGFAQYPLFAQCPHRVDWEQVVNVADQCLYAAKQSWRDAWVGVRCGSEPPSTDQLQQVSRRLPELIEQGSLEVLVSRSDDPNGLRWTQKK
ncbi:diguanylate cyclase [Wenzhouxiangella sp. AB-CW3]|uniref:diguanylate cyclase n=1 Tax=Wenzhouxiangella sp. AB-CW3 TaxID=2771012 RepID=UPI00168B4B73|nr:diguanylate cyclase [Wenzhouxiangella sp. AB-CW3]QOC21972.1 diguanylate cyclase [Wenzhouxiangella sp. AB-CW3]